MKTFKTILIIDSEGMAGHTIRSYLLSLKRYNVIDYITSRKLMYHESNNYYNDLLDIDKCIINNSPDYVINCLRVLVEESENNHEKAIFINSYLPHHLSNTCSYCGSRMIHLSTDCVFSGEKGNYAENDLKDGDSFYAKTKSLGELINKKDITIRTSFIGPNINDRNEELFHWFMLQKKEVKGYSNVLWSGVTTLELAKCINIAIENKLTGLYHVTNHTKISKYELLQLINEYFRDSHIGITPDPDISVDKSLISIYGDSIFHVSTYRQMIKELWEYVLLNKELYSHYF